MVSRCFPGGYNVKLYISRGRLAWWLLAFLCCGPIWLICCLASSGGCSGNYPSLDLCANHEATIAHSVLFIKLKYKLLSPGKRIKYRNACHTNHWNIPKSRVVICDLRFFAGEVVCVLWIIGDYPALCYPFCTENWTSYAENEQQLPVKTC